MYTHMQYIFFIYWTPSSCFSEIIFCKWRW